jgi:hypothetical protein
MRDLSSLFAEVELLSSRQVSRANLNVFWCLFTAQMKSSSLENECNIVCKVIHSIRADITVNIPRGLSPSTLTLSNPLASFRQKKACFYRVFLVYSDEYLFTGASQRAGGRLSPRQEALQGGVRAGWVGRRWRGEGKHGRGGGR